MSEETVPRLDLAPQRKRPLALWNPWDYLVLLYWLFFFPQAIRWYVEAFAEPQYRDSTGRELFKALRHDHVQRQLMLQALSATLCAVFGIAGLLLEVGVPVKIFGLAFGVAVGLAGGVAVGLAGGVARGLAVGVAISLSAGVVMGVGVAGGGFAGGGLAFGVAVAVIVVSIGGPAGLAFGLAFGVAGGVAGGVALGVVVGGLVSIAGVAGGGAGAVAGTVSRGVAVGVAVVAGGIAYGSSIVLTSTRLPDWLLVRVITPRFRWQLWNRMVWLPITATRRQLEAWLDQDWAAGIHNVNQFLSYSMQFISALRATNTVLERSSAEEILPRITTLADRPYDWDLVRFCSADLGNAIRQRMVHFPILPARWRRNLTSLYSTELRFDTLARSASAGFWLWHEEEAVQASEAFERIRGLPHGEELYRVAESLVEGEAVGSLETLGSMGSHLVWLDTLPDPELRPGTLQVLRRLRVIAQDAATAHHARSDLNRASALGRASGKLRELLLKGQEDCYPEPEWPLIKKIAERWQDIVTQAAGKAGEAVIREPVDNPYKGYSGLPVEPPCFVGRHDIFRRIENLWTTTDSLVPVFLFGHRRMGKTSILRNLDSALGANTLLAYLDMQDAGFVNHTGEMLFDLADVIHKRALESGLDVGETPTADRFTDLGKGRHELNALLKRLDPQMGERRLIVAIDEFEEIEDGIEKGRIDAGVIKYLRSLNQRYRWLGLILGGLHTLEEMGHDYKSAFWGQAEHVRVSYLSWEATIDLAARPHPDFALEYADDLLEELYLLTYGQPYLLQRLCWELVNRWNERFLKDGKKTPRVLELAELEPILGDTFFRGAEYYFEGVWENVTDEERQALRTMASREGSWRREEVRGGEEVLKLMLRHDVVLEEGGEVRFASELVRRWIVRSEQGPS